MEILKGSRSCLMAKAVMTEKPPGAAARKLVGKSQSVMRYITQAIAKELINITVVAIKIGIRNSILAMV